MLRRLYSAPRFRGRDRLIDAISKSYLPRPVQLPNGLFVELDCSEWEQLTILAMGSTEPTTGAAAACSVVGELWMTQFDVCVVTSLGRSDFGD